MPGFSSSVRAQEKAEKEALRREVAQLRLMVGEAEASQRRLELQLEAAAARAAKDAAAAEELSTSAATARGAAAALEAELAEARCVLDGTSRELGVVSSRYHRLEEQYTALRAARSGAGAAAGAGSLSADGSPSASFNGRQPAAAAAVAVASDGAAAAALASLRADALAAANADLQRQLEAAEARAAEAAASVSLLQVQNAALNMERLQLSGNAAALAACSLVQLRALEATLDSASRAVRDAVIQKTLQEAAKQAAAAEKAASEKAAEKAGCSLCMERPRSMAFGCGHQTCEPCGIKLTQCPFCRIDITAKIKLFDV